MPTKSLIPIPEYRSVVRPWQCRGQITFPAQVVDGAAVRGSQENIP